MRQNKPLKISLKIKQLFIIKGRVDVLRPARDAQYAAPVPVAEENCYVETPCTRYHACFYGILLELQKKIIVDNYLFCLN